MRVECALCGDRYDNRDEHKCKPPGPVKRKVAKPVEKIEASPKEVLPIAKGEAKSAKVVHSRKAKPSPALMRSLEVLATEKPSKPLTGVKEARAEAFQAEHTKLLPHEGAKKTSSVRTAKWRQKNPEKAREYHRNYMRAHRASASKGAGR